jgi:hypothetical protein
MVTLASRALPSGSGVVQQDGADHRDGVLDIGSLGDGQDLSGLAGEPVADDGLLGVKRRATTTAVPKRVRQPFPPR